MLFVHCLSQQVEEAQKDINNAVHQKQVSNISYHYWCIQSTNLQNSIILTVASKRFVMKITSLNQKRPNCILEEKVKQFL